MVLCPQHSKGRGSLCSSSGQGAALGSAGGDRGSGVKEPYGNSSHASLEGLSMVTSLTHAGQDVGASPQFI